MKSAVQVGQAYAGEYAGGHHSAHSPLSEEVSALREGQRVMASQLQQMAASLQAIQAQLSVQC